MRRVVVDMQNYLFADAVAQALKNADSDFDVHALYKGDLGPVLTAISVEDTQPADPDVATF